MFKGCSMVCLLSGYIGEHLRVLCSVLMAVRRGELGTPGRLGTFKTLVVQDQQFSLYFNHIINELFFFSAEVSGYGLFSSYERQGLLYTSLLPLESQLLLTCHQLDLQFNCLLRLCTGCLRSFSLAPQYSELYALFLQLLLPLLSYTWMSGAKLKIKFGSVINGITFFPQWIHVGYREEMSISILIYIYHRALANQYQTNSFQIVLLKNSMY